MKTSLSAEFQNTQTGEEAEALIGKCVHCGFCNATCPTYQLLGDEMDGPRGRIYLMKQMFEGEKQSLDKIQFHLDRCLTCRNCETTCPSGVQYSKILELGRATLSSKTRRSGLETLFRSLIAAMLRQPGLFKLMATMSVWVKPLAPKVIRKKIPVARKPTLDWPDRKSSRTMIALSGCAQGALAPDTNRAAAQVLSRYGISLIEVPAAGCCGAVDLHTTSEHKGIAVAKKLIDVWTPHLDEIEAFAMTASGCGVTIREYPHLFRHDSEYLEKATRIAAKTLDLSEIIEREVDGKPKPSDRGKKVAFHAPCTLQHGQKLPGRIEKILEWSGYEVVPVKDGNLCCGSAGTYSLLQPAISHQLRQNKLNALHEREPDLVCTANIGCQMHLSDPGKPVHHWIELLL
ncbi:MAG: glycolate oxidase subunit GlcF [Gammaproteobacteria bacterium]|nr:glycolate oxidase subunit GlcF [Gammaproteobacteria bacterium]